MAKLGSRKRDSGVPTRRKNEIPVDVYIPFVETLFRDGTTLAIGIVAQALIAAMVFVKTLDPVYLSIAITIVSIGTLRLFSIARSRKAFPLVDIETARHHENIYIFWGSLHASVLGLFCFLGIYGAQDQFAEIASVCVTLASITSIAGRNYGSPRLVMFQIVAATWPISLALATLAVDLPARSCRSVAQRSSRGGMPRAAATRSTHRGMDTFHFGGHQRRRRMATARARE